jgi:hypothetical protein
MSTGISRRGVIVTVLATLLISSLATHASAEGRCNNASLLGSYAFQVDGTNVNGPFAAVGKNSYDGKGHLKGVIVVSSNGAIIPTTYTGTYTLNADCTGIKSAALDIGLTVDFYFVVDSNLREIRMIVTDPGFTVSGTARKLFTDANGRQKGQD